MVTHQRMNLWVGIIIGKLAGTRNHAPIISLVPRLRKPFGIDSKFQFVVAMRALALFDKAILLLGDCFGQEQARLTATFLK